MTVLDAPAPAAAAPAAPAAAPAATPAAPSAAPAAAAPAPAAFESLIHGDPAAAPAPGAAPAAAPAPAAGDDPFAPLLGQVPEKFHVKAGDKIDAAATLAKALEHRANLEQRLGAGDIRPKTSAEYAFTPPEALKDIEFKSEKMESFRNGFHERGGTQALYEFVMNSYLDGAGDLVEGVVKLKANECRAELQKVWPVTTEYEAGINNASRALRGLPADVQESLREYGTTPAVLRALAHYGAQMREDAPPSGGGGSPASATAEQLMADPAYRDPKNPRHADVSRQVQQIFARTHGTTPI
jgi:hypothetical protein